jgi:hypothetical protein
LNLRAKATDHTALEQTTALREVLTGMEDMKKVRESAQGLRSVLFGSLTAAVSKAERACPCRVDT